MAATRRCSIARAAIEQPSPASLERLAHEFELKDELDGAWAMRRLELVREGGVTLALEDPGGEPLERLLDAPTEVGNAGRLAVGITAALGKPHEREQQASEPPETLAGTLAYMPPRTDRAHEPLDRRPQQSLDNAPPSQR
ncbi:hypothetical protein [Paraburkholderia sp. JHI869]|uniref:hypothetical protein n=1 Tax=Paraburkholderia sp. JHI869 TaxID=3112959 RepID=UPI0031732A71